MKTLFEPDHDYNAEAYESSRSVKSLSGTITDARREKILRWCKRMTWKQFCGCEHDCCGCSYAADFVPIFPADGGVIIIKTVYYNR